MIKLFSKLNDLLDTALLVDRIHTLEGRLKDAHHYARAAEDRADVAEGEAASLERTASVYERQRDRECQRAELASEREQSARRVAAKYVGKARREADRARRYYRHARALAKVARSTVTWDVVHSKDNDRRAAEARAEGAERALADVRNQLAILRTDFAQEDLTDQGEEARAPMLSDAALEADALRRDLDIARGQISRAAAAVDRALAGVPAYVPEGERQSTKEAPHV